jgi:hypothetical protein
MGSRNIQCAVLLSLTCFLFSSCARASESPVQVGLTSNRKGQTKPPRTVRPKQCSKELDEEVARKKPETVTFTGGARVEVARLRPVRLRTFSVGTDTLRGNLRVVMAPGDRVAWVCLDGPIRGDGPPESVIMIPTQFGSRRLELYNYVTDPQSPVWGPETFVVR